MYQVSVQAQEGGQREWLQQSWLRGQPGSFELREDHLVSSHWHLTMQQTLFYTFPHFILTDAFQAAVNITSIHQEPNWGSENLRDLPSITGLRSNRTEACLDGPAIIWRTVCRVFSEQKLYTQIPHSSIAYAMLPFQTSCGIKIAALMLPRFQHRDRKHIPSPLHPVCYLDHLAFLIWIMVWTLEPEVTSASTTN